MLLSVHSLLTFSNVCVVSLQVEFAVHMTCDKCVKKISSALEGIDGIEHIDISLDKGTVLVHSNLPSAFIQDKIESTGCKAVLKGYGSGKSECKYV